MLIRFMSGYGLFPLLEHKAGRKISSKVKELRAFDKLTNEEQLQFQRRYLKEFVSFCGASVPYYKELFRSVNFSPDLIDKDVKYIQNLPLLSKEIVRQESTQLRMPGAHHTRKTGGSTGQSVFFYYDDSGLDWTAAINLMALEMAGKMPHHSDMHMGADEELWGRVPPTGKAKLIDWLKLRSQNRSRLPISSFSQESLERAFQMLSKKRPFLLQGHPSSARAIADHVRRYHQGKVDKLCTVFEPSGEMLTQATVDTIESTLGCRVVNRYGNAEFGVVAHSAPGDSWRKLKVFRRAFYVEECNRAELTVTGFTNYGFPLIRYSTGDVGTVVEEKDGCYLFDIEGRIHDVVQINGKPWSTSFLMDTLDHQVRGVREFQVVIGELEDPILQIVPESFDDCDRISKELRKTWPVGLNIRFIPFERLEKVGWRQKFRHVIHKSEVYVEAT